MKKIIIGSVINLLLLSLGLTYAFSIIVTNPKGGFVIYMIVSLFTPIIGFLYNSITQRNYNIITSTIYTSLFTSLLVIFPIELFKHSERVFKAKEIVMNQYSNNNSNLTLNIDLSFDLANHITSTFIWILIATVIGFIVQKLRKVLNNTKRRSAI